MWKKLKHKVVGLSDAGASVSEIALVAVRRAFRSAFLGCLRVKDSRLGIAHRLRRQRCAKVEHPSSRTDAWKESLERARRFITSPGITGDQQGVLDRCRLACEGRFHLLGCEYRPAEKHQKETSGGHGSSSAVPWFHDPATGFAWQNDVWYLESRTGPAGTDIKLPWELSRCYHFLALGQGYQWTGERRYVEAFKKQVHEWIQSNPIRYGPNWACAMEVGIRIANWLVGLLYFLDSACVDDAFLSMLLSSVDEHGRHIERNLENLGFFTSNHYLGDIAGLYFVGAMCPVLKRSSRWRRFAKRELEREILKQTWPDGWDNEASTAYHRLVLEMFLFAYLLGVATDDPFSAQYVSRLRDMLICLVAATKPNGQLPQIGDNDSGRFLVFNADEPPESLSMRYLHEYGACFFGIRPEERPTSVAFPDAGRYVFRSPDVYLLVAAGPKGQAGNGGHAHNDVLSFELNAAGNDVFVDPGTYVYTRDGAERNAFRSVENHNTLFWPGKEPCSLDRGIFCLREEGSLTIESVDMGGRVEKLIGRYEYDGRFHRREITFPRDSGELVLADRCSHSGACVAFVCAPAVELRRHGHTICADRVRVSFDGAERVDVIDAEYSPSYGVRVPTKKVLVHLAGLELRSRIVCGLR